MQSNNAGPQAAAVRTGRAWRLRDEAEADLAPPPTCTPTPPRAAEGARRAGVLASTTSARWLGENDAGDRVEDNGVTKRRKRWPA